MHRLSKVLLQQSMNIEMWQNNDTIILFNSATCYGGDKRAQTVHKLFLRDISVAPSILETVDRRDEHRRQDRFDGVQKAAPVARPTRIQLCKIHLLRRTGNKLHTFHESFDLRLNLTARVRLSTYVRNMFLGSMSNRFGAQLQNIKCLTLKMKVKDIWDLAEVRRSNLSFVDLQTDYKHDVCF